MEVYEFVKDSYDAFHGQLKQKWEISFNDDKIFHGMKDANGHEDRGISPLLASSLQRHTYGVYNSLRRDCNENGWENSLDQAR